MKQFIKSIFASAFGFLLAQLTIVFLFFAFLGVMGRSSHQPTTDAAEESAKAQILNLHLFGDIPDHKERVPDSFRPFVHRDLAYSLPDYIKAIQAAQADEDIAGIYLSIDHLSAGWANLTTLRKSLVAFKESGKFIYTYSDSYSEKSYYLASTADSIYLYSQGSFEHNGIASIPMFVKGLLQKLEVKPLIFRVGTYKSAVEPLTRTSMSSEARQQSQTLLFDLWNHYLETISKSRGLSIEQLTTIAEKLSVNNAKQAFDSKLVDVLRSESELFEDLKTKLSIPKDKKLYMKKVSAYLKDDKKNRFSFSQRQPKLEGDHIAIIHVEGEIHMGYSDEDTVGSKSVVRQLRKVKKDEAIKAVVIRINSPGGSALASDIIWKEAAAIDAIKPVVISMGNVTASGGYYIASGGRYIFAEPTTITGSIGVFGVLFNLKDFFNNKLGITTDRVYTHNYSDIGQSSREMTPFERSVIQKETEITYDRFLQIVSSARNIPTNEVDKIGQGRVWSGVAAQKVGLVDELGDLQMATKKAAELAGISDFEIHKVPPREEPWQWLFGSLGAKVRSYFISQEEWQFIRTVRQMKKWNEVMALDLRLLDHP